MRRGEVAPHAAAASVIETPHLEHIPLRIHRVAHDEARALPAVVEQRAAEGGDEFGGTIEVGHGEEELDRDVLAALWR